MSDEKITFSEFIVSLAQTAYVQLGIVEDPFSKKKNKNLQAAAETIDLIEMLKEKTKGNLNKEEEALLDEVLYDLRMKYLYESKDESRNQ